MRCPTPAFFYSIWNCFSTVCFLLINPLGFTKITRAYPVAKFLVSDWGMDIVDSGTGLSYRPARLHRLEAGTKTLSQSRLCPPVSD